MKIPEISGVHRPPEVKWRDEGTIVDWGGGVARGGRYGKNITFFIQNIQNIQTRIRFSKRFTFILDITN